MTKHEPLEELENLIKTHFGDLLVSVAVSASGSLFLSIWQQPSEHPVIYMNYLPLFYIIGGVDEDSRISLKLITFHGKVLEELIEHDIPLVDDEKIKFISKLSRIQLCQGVKIPDNELKLDPQTFAFLYLVEQLEKNVIIRSRQCKFGLYDEQHGVCEACSALNKENIIKGTDNREKGDDAFSPVKRSRGRPRVHPIKEVNYTAGTKRGRGRPKTKIDYNEDKTFTMVDDIALPGSYNDTEDVKPLLLKNVKVELNDGEDDFENDFDNEDDYKIRDSQEDLTDNQIDIKTKQNHETRTENLGQMEFHSDIKGEELANVGEIKVFYCEECDERFAVERDLQTHIADTKHKSQVLAKCFICQKIFCDSFRTHLWNAHWNLKPYQCKHCDYTAARQSQVMAHYRKIHHEITGYPGNPETDTILLPDVVRAIDEKEKKYGLQLGRTVAENTGADDGYEKYFWHDFGANIRPFFCDECNEKFSSANQLHIHCTDLAHTSEKRAICFICDQTIAYADKTLRTHVYTSHLKLKPFKCKYCDYTSATKGKIDPIHLQKHHSDIEWTRDDVEFLGDVMRMIDDFERKHNLQLGIPMIEKLHTGRFSRTSLKRPNDSLINSNDATSMEIGDTSAAMQLKHKPFMCDECGKTFTSAINLHAHLEDFFHKSKETAVCFQCGDILETRVDFRKHLWSHNNFKPYKCKDCNFTSTIKEHVFNQHAVHTHGKCGTLNDVEILMDVMEQIDVYEQGNHLELGPPMVKNKKRIRNAENGMPTLRKGKFKKGKPGRKPGRPKLRDIKDVEIKQEIGDYTDGDFEGEDIKPANRRGRPGRNPKFDNTPRGPPKQRFKEDCVVCLCTFNSKEDFDKDQEKHQQQLANQETVQCPTCAVTIGKVQLNHHYITDHPELKAGCCTECVTIIAPRSKMSKHVAAVHKPKNDLCPICGKNFRNVRDHVAVKHGEKVRNHVCDTCGKKFTHPLLLSAHISKIHSIRKQLPCKFCGQIFMEKNPLRFHYWAIHLKVKPYKCKHCHYCGTQPQKIYEHCRSVHKFPGGKKDVEHVEEDFARIREFETQHGLNRQEFKASREFLCWLCKKDCQSNQGLLKHEFGHLNLSPFECKRCYMKFKMKVLLQSHLDKRHNEKVSASVIDGNPEIMSLYGRVRKIPPNIVEVYNEYKNTNPTVVEEKNGEKRVNTVCCKKCQFSSSNYAEFLDHFNLAHGYEFSHLHEQVNSAGIESDIAPDPEQMLRCKCCGFETLIGEVLDKHIVEVHRFTPDMYDQFIEAPKVEPTQKMYRPRKYRCRYCLVYTAVKKFTVHRHIRNTHGVQETFEHDVLLISESEHLLHSVE